MIAGHELPAGWYNSPLEPEKLQWWDGKQWVGEPVSPPSAQRPRSKSRRTRKSLFWATLGATTAVALVAIFAAYAYKDSQINEINAATESTLEEASKSQSIVTAERERLETFADAAEECSIRDTHSFYILDSGESVEFTLGGKYNTNSPDSFSVICFMDEVGAPSSTWSRIETTRALDGRQEDSWPGFRASWTYHPDSGLKMLIEHVL